MSKEREHIPEDIKRDLRKEARFGCCRCGFPFIEYHHIIPHSIVNEHSKDNMMVVCSRCHDLITAGVIPEEEQRLLKNNPKNKEIGNIQGEIFLRKNTVTVGGTYFRCNGAVLVMDSDPIIIMTHDIEANLLLSLKLYDKEDKLLAYIRENEWVVIPDGTWDLMAKPGSIIIKNALRKISLKITLVDNNVRITGSFWKNGHLMKIGKDVLEIGDLEQGFGICEFSNMYISIDTKNKTADIKLGNGLHPYQSYK